jgi:hypothetical protein
MWSRMSSGPRRSDGDDEAKRDSSHVLPSHELAEHPIVSNASMWRHLPASWRVKVRAAHEAVDADAEEG